MDLIKELCEDNSLQLVEDCAQAHGAKFQGKLVGTFGIGAFYTLGWRILHFTFGTRCHTLVTNLLTWDFTERSSCFSVGIHQ